MNYFGNLPVVATGTISPSVFLMGDTTRDYAVKQAVGSPMLVGVSQAGTKNAPGLITALGGTAPSPEPAAVSGDPVGVFFHGDICGITVGSTDVTPWSLVTNDGNGCAIPATSTKYAGGMVFSAGSLNNIIACLVLPPGIKA